MKSERERKHQAHVVLVVKHNRQKTRERRKEREQKNRATILTAAGLSGEEYIPTCW